MRLIEVRKKKGVSQAEVAEFINITQSNYSKYERGDIEPDLSTLIKLADYFKVSTDYLLEHKIPYLINKSEFSSKQLEVIEEIKTLNNEQCDFILAFIKTIKEKSK